MPVAEILPRLSHWIGQRHYLDLVHPVPALHVVIGDAATANNAHSVLFLPCRLPLLEVLANPLDSRIRAHPLGLDHELCSLARRAIASPSDSLREIISCPMHQQPPRRTQRQRRPHIAPTRESPARKNAPLHTSSSPKSQLPQSTAVLPTSLASARANKHQMPASPLTDEVTLAHAQVLIQIGQTREDVLHPASHRRPDCTCGYRGSISSCPSLSVPSVRKGATTSTAPPSCNSPCANAPGLSPPQFASAISVAGTLPWGPRGRKKRRAHPLPMPHAPQD